MIRKYWTFGCVDDCPAVCTVPVKFRTKREAVAAARAHERKLPAHKNQTAVWRCFEADPGDEVDRLREALWYYAARNAWDRGRVARKALGLP